MNNQKQITKKQHWVPQFYLKQFADEKGDLQVLDLERRGLGKPRAYGSVCWKEFFYGVETGVEDEVSQQIEEYYRQIENKAADLLDVFSKKVLGNEELSDSLVYSMAFFMSSLWSRSYYFRKQTIDMGENMSKRLFRRHVMNSNFSESIKEISQKYNKPVTDDDIQELYETIVDGRFKIEFNNGPHLRFLATAERFTNLFYNKHWRIYIANGEGEFITSDTPISEVIPERVGFFGASFLERTHYFPVTPKILIELIYPLSGKKVKRKKIDKLEIAKYNCVKADYSLEYCYSRSRTDLQIIVDLIERLNPLAQLRRKSIFV